MSELVKFHRIMVVTGIDLALATTLLTKMGLAILAMANWGKCQTILQDYTQVNQGGGGRLANLGLTDKHVIACWEILRGPLKVSKMVGGGSEVSS